MNPVSSQELFRSSRFLSTRGARLLSSRMRAYPVIQGARVSYHPGGACFLPPRGRAFPAVPEARVVPGARGSYRPGGTCFLSYR